MARSRDYKSIRYDSAIDGHCAACSSSNLRQASSNRRSMSRGWLAERTGTTRPRRRRRAVRHMPYLPHRTHQLALRARRGSQQERHRLSAGPQRKPSSSFSHGTRDNVILKLTLNYYRCFYFAYCMINFRYSILDNTSLLILYLFFYI